MAAEKIPAPEALLRYGAGRIYLTLSGLKNYNQFMENKEVTNKELARMIGEGFHGVDEKLTDLRGEMNQRFDEVNTRLDHLENLIDNDYKRRIEK